jgi:hypothetical protein
LGDSGAEAAAVTICLRTSRLSNPTGSFVDI